MVIGIIVFVFSQTDISFKEDFELSAPQQLMFFIGDIYLVISMFSLQIFRLRDPYLWIKVKGLLFFWMDSSKKSRIPSSHQNSMSSNLDVDLLSDVLTS